MIVCASAAQRLQEKNLEDCTVTGQGAKPAPVVPCVRLSPAGTSPVFLHCSKADTACPVSDMGATP